MIGITPENTVFREQERISAWIRSNEVAYFHIRKPNYNEREMCEYLDRFDLDIRERLTLNDYQYLAREFSIGGVHINSRFRNASTIAEDIVDIYGNLSNSFNNLSNSFNNTSNSFNNTTPMGINIQKEKQLRLSVSCHSIEQVRQWAGKVDYCFLSPILNSISKEGYRSKFSRCALQEAFHHNFLDTTTVALGGVTFNNLDMLSSLGFSSFAMLSGLWQLPQAMFISHTNEYYNYLEGCIAALAGGIRFIQLRMKEADDEQIIATARLLRKECDKYGAILTIDDKIHLLDTNLFDGVHLGKQDIPIGTAKQITKDRYLLGATCNTVDDVRRAVSDGADYLGVGPYRYTTTKSNLATILKEEGYVSIVRYLQHCNCNIPVYAIGGIRTDDITKLLKIGVYGIALSNEILNSGDAQKRSEKIINIIKEYNKDER